MPGAGELLGRGQSRRSRTHDRHALARRDGGGLGLDEAVHPGLVDDRLLDALDRDGATRLTLGDRQHAGRLARRGAQPTGELRKVVGRVQPVAGRVPPATAHQVVPLGDQIPQRTARGSGVAERDSAIHAAARLLRHLAGSLVGVLAFVHLAPVTHPLVDRPLGGLDLGDLQKADGISHGSPP